MARSPRSSRAGSTAAGNTTQASRAPAFDPSILPLKIGGGVALVRFRNGELIYAQGDSADSVLYVGAGKVKISIHSPSGKEALLAILGPGEFFGESCLNRLTLRIANASAMTDCAIMRVSIPAMRRALRSDPAFSELFVTHLVERGLSVFDALADQLLNSAERRLARTLLRLANLGGGGQGALVVNGISHEMLAGMVGATRSRITHFMSNFRKLGLISYDRKGLRIHDGLLHFVLHD